MFVYTLKSQREGGVIMNTAKLFNNGHSQAVRLPKAFRFEGSEVFIKRVQEGVLLMPKKHTIWDQWFESLCEFDVSIDRGQSLGQVREGLDELFD